MMKPHPMILLALGALLGTSCMVYHPHTTDIPLLHEKGDLHLDGCIELPGPLIYQPALDATVTYAPINHLGVQVAASATDLLSYHLQGAVGTFLPYRMSVLEGYVGYAYGSTRRNDQKNGTIRTDSRYSLYFAQVNFGWTGLADNCIDFGLGVKTGLMKPDFNRYSTADGIETRDAHYTDPSFLLQPQAMFRFGWAKFKISVNLSYAFLNKWPRGDNYFNYSRVSIGFGLHYKI